jgi:hypothetical protein
MGQHYHARLGGKVMCIVETSLVCGLFGLVCVGRLKQSFDDRAAGREMEEIENMRAYGFVKSSHTVS